MLHLQWSKYQNLVDVHKSYQKKLIPGAGIEITEDNTINVTLDNSIFKVVDEFPEKPDAKDAGKIFVVANPEGESGNSFVEKIYVDGKWETVGEFKPEVDLTPYLKITVVDGKQVAVLPENAQIMGTLGAGIYALLSLRDYGEGVVQVEVGTATQHLCLNSKDRVTVDTADGKKEFAYLTDMPDLEPYATKTECNEKYQPKGDYALKSELPAEPDFRGIYVYLPAGTVPDLTDQYVHHRHPGLLPGHGA